MVRFPFFGWLWDCVLLINMYAPMRYVKRKNAGRNIYQTKDSSHTFILAWIRTSSHLFSHRNIPPSNGPTILDHEWTWSWHGTRLVARLLYIMTQQMGYEQMVIFIKTSSQFAWFRQIKYSCSNSKYPLYCLGCWKSNFSMKCSGKKLSHPNILFKYKCVYMKYWMQQFCSSSNNNHNNNTLSVALCERTTLNQAYICYSLFSL